MQRHIDTQIQALRQEFITMGLEVKAALEKAIISLKKMINKLLKRLSNTTK